MAADDPIRILVMDDHPVVRDGLRGQLSSQRDLRVVAEAGSAEEALALLAHQKIDVVLTDLRMPGIGGIELIRRVRAGHPTVEILVLTTYDTDDDLRPAMAAGARGYLLKDTGRDMLFAGIRAARAGAPIFSPSVSYRATHPQPPPVLSAREVEALRLVADGRTNSQIAAALFIGQATVKTHLQHIFAKLDVPDRAAAVAAGHRLHLLR